MKQAKQFLALLLVLLLCLWLAPSASAETYGDWKYDIWAMYDDSDEMAGLGYLVEIEGRVFFWSDTASDSLYAEIGGLDYSLEAAYVLLDEYTLYTAVGKELPQKYAAHFRLPEVGDEVMIQYICDRDGLSFETSTYSVLADALTEQDARFYAIAAEPENMIDESNVYFNFPSAAFLEDGSFCGIYYCMEGEEYDVIITVQAESVISAVGAKNTSGETGETGETDAEETGKGVSLSGQDIGENELDGEESGQQKLLLYGLGALLLVGAAALCVFLVKKRREELRHTPPGSPEYLLHGLSGTFANRQFRIDEPLRLGRDPARCNTLYPDALTYISGLHCELRLQGGTIYLQDCGSRNGTYLNGVRLEPNRPVALKGTDVFYLVNPEEKFAVEYTAGGVNPELWKPPV